MVVVGKLCVFLHIYRCLKERETWSGVGLVEKKDKLKSFRTMRLSPYGYVVSSEYFQAH